MWDEILRLAVGNGLWAVLFCLLLIYQLRDSRAREGKYQRTISALCDRLSVVEAVKETVDETLKAVKSGKNKRVKGAVQNSADGGKTPVTAELSADLSAAAP